jgi:hypothetical protein
LSLATSAYNASIRRRQKNKAVSAVSEESTDRQTGKHYFLAKKGNLHAVDSHAAARSQSTPHCDRRENRENEEESNPATQVG